MQRRCEGNDCPVLSMVRKAQGIAPGNHGTLLPVGAREMVSFVKGLQQDFSGYRCSVAQVLTGVQEIPPLGLVCIGTEDGSCLRVLLNSDDVDRLVIALQGIQVVMQAWKTARAGQVH